jgi:hypothetical protein
LKDIPNDSVTGGGLSRFRHFFENLPKKSITALEFEATSLGVSQQVENKYKRFICLTL